MMMTIVVLRLDDGLEQLAMMMIKYHKDLLLLVSSSLFSHSTQLTASLLPTVSVDVHR